MSRQTPVMKVSHGEQTYELLPYIETFSSAMFDDARQDYEEACAEAIVRAEKGLHEHGGHINAMRTISQGSPDPDKNHFLVDQVTQQRVVAWVNFQLPEHKEYWQLHILYVRKAERRCGLGYAVATQMVRHWQSHGYPRVKFSARTEGMRRIREKLKDEFGW